MIRLRHVNTPAVFFCIISLQALCWQYSPLIFTLTLITVYVSIKHLCDCIIFFWMSRFSPAKLLVLFRCRTKAIACFSRANILSVLVQINTAAFTLPPLILLIACTLQPQNSWPVEASVQKPKPILSSCYSSFLKSWAGMGMECCNHEWFTLQLSPERALLTGPP